MSHVSFTALLPGEPDFRVTCPGHHGSLQNQFPPLFFFALFVISLLGGHKVGNGCLDPTGVCCVERGHGGRERNGLKAPCQSATWWCTVPPNSPAPDSGPGTPAPAPAWKLRAVGPTPGRLGSPFSCHPGEALNLSSPRFPHLSGTANNALSRRVAVSRTRALGPGSGPQEEPPTGVTPV